MPVSPPPAVTPIAGELPNRGQTETQFDTNQQNFVNYQANFGPEVNDVTAWMNDVADQTEVWANEAEVSATASEESRLASDAILVEAEAAAAAAQQAAGFPTDPNFGSVFRSEGVENLKTANFTAVVGRVYDCDTSAGGFTVTLPASLSIGDWIGLRDISGTWSLNNLTVNRNGHNIFGEAVNEILDMNQSTVFLEYRGVTLGVIY